MFRPHVTPRESPVSVALVEHGRTNITTFHPSTPETYIPSECTRAMKPRTSRITMSTVGASRISPSTKPDYAQPEFNSRLAGAIHYEHQKGLQEHTSAFQEVAYKHADRPAEKRVYGDHHDFFYPAQECGLTGPLGSRFCRNPENIGQEDKDRRVQVTNARQGTRHANEERIRATYAKEEHDAQQREAKKIAGKRRQREVYMTMLQENLETQM
ncbi:Hypothetical protein GLP15_3001 [Giardia lamblia P15]|uniref:Uncharacterized protein n=1 Tax=Giardia intestinalis (strain P15) TaxID=658858 RepID=E1EYY9_GIAIA|nr:Hypothetical protein GLP15_3001 [Giardia lamblia P15]